MHTSTQKPFRSRLHGLMNTSLGLSMNSDFLGYFGDDRLKKQVKYCLIKCVSYER